MEERRPKILIVDDAAYMRLMLKKILINNGYEVLGEADSVKQAITYYKSLKPELVIIDICMPIDIGSKEKDRETKLDEMKGGIEAIKKIIAIDPSAQIIVCSALGDKDMVMEAIKAGAKNYILKPFTPQHLIDTIKQIHVASQ